VDQGIDPTDQARQQREKAEAARAAARRKAMLVSEAWDAYIKKHRTHWGARHLADHRNLAQAAGQQKKRGEGTTVQGVLRPLLEMRLGDINADTLAAWQREKPRPEPTAPGRVSSCSARSGAGARLIVITRTRSTQVLSRARTCARKFPPKEQAF